MLLLPKVTLPDVKINTNTGMKKYPRCDKCGKYISLILAFMNQFTGANKAPGGGCCGKRGDLLQKILLNALNTEISVSAIRAAEKFISTSSEEADEATKLPKLKIKYH